MDVNPSLLASKPHVFLFNYWLHWVFSAALTFSSCSAQASPRGGFSCCGAQALGIWAWASVVVAHGPSWPEACGIFLDQGWNLCTLHWQADS